MSCSPAILHIAFVDCVLTTSLLIEPACGDWKRRKQNEISNSELVEAKNKNMGLELSNPNEMKSAKIKTCLRLGEEFRVQK